MVPDGTALARVVHLGHAVPELVTVLNKLPTNRAARLVDGLDRAVLAHHIELVALRATLEVQKAIHRHGGVQTRGRVQGVDLLSVELKAGSLEGGSHLSFGVLRVTSCPAWPDTTTFFRAEPPWPVPPFCCKRSGHCSSWKTGVSGRDGFP